MNGQYEVERTLKNIGIAYIRSSHLPGLRETTQGKVSFLQGRDLDPLGRGHNHGSVNGGEVIVVPCYQNLPETHSLWCQENCSWEGI